MSPSRTTTNDINNYARQKVSLCIAIVDIGNKKGMDDVCMYMYTRANEETSKNERDGTDRRHRRHRRHSSVEEWFI
jgi:hypothetical protein